MSQPTTAPAPAAPSPTDAVTDAAPGIRRSLVLMALDLGLPVGAYLVTRDVFGASMIAGFAASSAVSLVWLLVVALRDRTLSALSALVLTVNVVGLALSFVSGSVRIVSGKDAVISSVIGLGILYSAWRGRPALAPALRPFVTNGHRDRESAWETLSATSGRFRRLVTLHSVVFGVAFVVDSAVRVVCAALAPVSVLGWIGTAATVAAMVVGVVVSGAVSASPLDALLGAAAHEAPAAG